MIVFSLGLSVLASWDGISAFAIILFCDIPPPDIMTYRVPMPI